MTKYPEKPPVDHSVVNEKAFELPRMSKKAFLKVLRSLIHDQNLGAGIDVSGASGSGKSCFAELFCIECLKAGIPSLFIDPHGNSVERVMRQVQLLPDRIQRKVRYVRLSDPNMTLALNPLAKSSLSSISPYRDRCEVEIQISMVANCILAAVGEAATGFTSRPVLEKWFVRWLTILVKANLTLPCASMLLDPNHPVYRQMLKLVGDELAHFQMESLSKMRSFEQEAEIGSARNRLVSVLRHPAVVAMLSRTDPVLVFQELYDTDTSLLVNADCGETLTPHVQSLLANIILTQYLQVVFRTPEAQRRRRFLIIDELPIFMQSSGLLLQRCCTEIRKYMTSMVLLHQGANRFADRTNDPFLATILDMCTTKVFFRHAYDAEFFGKIIARAAGSKLVMKRVQINTQQFQDGYSILDLVDRSEGAVDANATGATNTSTQGFDQSDSISECLRDAAESVRATTTAHSSAVSNSTNTGYSQVHTSSRSSSTTYKQTAVANVVNELVVTGVQYYTKEEIDQGAIDLVANLPTGEAVFFIDGKVKPIHVQVPLLLDPFAKAPKFGAQKVRNWLARLYELPFYASPEKMLSEYEEFTQQLVSYLAEQPPRAGIDNRAQTLIQSNLINQEQIRPDELGL